MPCVYYWTTNAHAAPRHSLSRLLPNACLSLIPRPSLVPRLHPQKGGKDLAHFEPFLVFADSAFQINVATLLSVRHVHTAVSLRTMNQCSLCKSVLETSSSRRLFSPCASPRQEKNKQSPVVSKLFNALGNTCSLLN